MNTVRLIIFSILLLCSWNKHALAMDLVTGPPLERHFTSANGLFELVILRQTSSPRLEFPHVILYRVEQDGKRIQIWNKTLNFYLGPRFVVINDKGFVVFFDEWMLNPETAFAIQVFSPEDEGFHTFSLKEVLIQAGLNWSATNWPDPKKPEYGLWLSKEPTLLDPDHIEVAVGDISLVLQISTASLRVQQQ